MKPKKYIAQVLAFNTFRFALYGLVTVLALWIVFATSARIKQTFISTEAYSRFVPLSIKEAAKLNKNSGAAPLKDPAIQDIITQSFPADTLQTESEKVIDSMYAWLNGQTKEPEFTVDFSPNIDEMATKLSSYGIERLKSLPPCDIEPQTVDPFTANCRPSVFDYDTAQATLAADIQANNGILEKTVFTSNDLPKGPDSSSFAQQYNYAPTLFKLLRYAPVILLAITVASAIIAISLDRNKRQATNRIGTSIIGATVFLILSPIVYFYILPLFFPGLSMNTATGGADAVLGDVFNKLSVDFSNQLILVGSLLLVIGILVVVVEKITRPQSKYIRVDKKAGLASSEAPRIKRGKTTLDAKSVPVQSSEGKRPTSKYQKSRKYRKIAKKEF